MPDSDVVAQAWDAWLAVVMFAEQFVDAEPSLDFTGSYHTGEPISLREVLVHMIEEYARHNGHADLLRERVDGKVGQRAGGSAWAIRPPVPGPSHLPT